MCNVWMKTTPLNTSQSTTVGQFAQAHSVGSNIHYTNVQLRSLDIQRPLFTAWFMKYSVSYISLNNTLIFVATAIGWSCTHSTHSSNLFNVNNDKKDFLTYSTQVSHYLTVSAALQAGVFDDFRLFRFPKIVCGHLARFLSKRLYIQRPTRTQKTRCHIHTPNEIGIHDPNGRETEATTKLAWRGQCARLALMFLMF